MTIKRTGQDDTHTDPEGTDDDDDDRVQEKETNDLCLGPPLYTWNSRSFTSSCVLEDHYKTLSLPEHATKAQIKVHHFFNPIVFY